MKQDRHTCGQLLGSCTPRSRGGAGGSWRATPGLLDASAASSPELPGPQALPRMGHVTAPSLWHWWVRDRKPQRAQAPGSSRGEARGWKLLEGLSSAPPTLAEKVQRTNPGPCDCDASEASQPERGWEGGRCSPGGVPLCWPHPLSWGPSAAPSPQEVTQAPSRAPASPPPAAATSVPVTQACGRLPAQTRRGGMSPRAVPVSGGLCQACPQHPLCRGGVAPARPPFPAPPPSPRAPQHTAPHPARPCDYCCPRALLRVALI